ncbi:uncharacterized protein JCM10292_001769 [Rhodotorula paludigena]|uniref:uncharacterized protein n=1 Tax=Rhodotorula paludigena TaxID=86838 RepID=UPI00316C02F5
MSIPTFVSTASNSFASPSPNYASSSHHHHHHPQQHQSFAVFAEQHPPAADSFTCPSFSTRSPHSSSSSVSSGASSSSPTSSATAMRGTTSDEAHQRGRPRRLTGDSSASGAPRSTDGSVGSLATTISTGSPPPKSASAAANEDEEMRDGDGPLRMKERDRPAPRSSELGRRRRSGSGAMDISTLSVREEEDDGSADDQHAHQLSPSQAADERPRSGEDAQLGTGHTKTRSASVLSSASLAAAHAQPGTVTGPAGSRRKVARMSTSASDDGASDQSAPSPEIRMPVQRDDEDSTAANTPQQPSPAVTPNTAPTEHHVDIVSYPSSELLRLLACLLEQIAQANDARNARAAQTAAATPAGSADAAANDASVQPQRSTGAMEGEADWSRGRFDAAPLNSPVTPRHRRRAGSGGPGGPGGPGILDNALDGDGEPLDEDEEAERDNEMPLTPGVDLLRETGPGGGVEGFMPSLGGTHAPMPLSRRRGSSFLRNKRAEDGSIPPSFGRRASAAVTQPPASAPSSSQGPSPTASSTSGSRPGPSPLGATPASSSNHLSSEPPLTSLLTASSVALSSPNATLCFHARNVPAISIEAYLQRILKYCPTTNEVFLALLVYFDRMARIGLEAQRLGLPREAGGGGGPSSEDAANPNKFFAIDSYNVHRLVIAGVTVASKFFSDVFYTNSRYAKVGGLPLNELNQLELQFLLLNDFRLKIPVDELQRYADQLILYWIGRNGTSNPAAAATAASRAASQQREPAAVAPASARTPMAPSTAVETPPLTRSAVAAASAQAAESPLPQTRPPPGSSSGNPPYPSHLAHSSHSPAPPPSSSATGGDAQGTPVSRPFATGSFYQPGSASGASAPTSSSFASQHGPTPAHSGVRPSPHRPRSVRSQPSTSSSFSSSTVTPGTPSTTRTLGSSGVSSDDEGEDAAEGDDGMRGRSRRGSAVKDAMEED